MSNLKKILFPAILLVVLSLNLNAQKKKFSGTVKGQISAPIKNDISSNTPINSIGLAGLEVDLRYKKGGIYHRIGTTYTDEKGNYNISYNKPLAKNRTLAFFVRVRAKTNSAYNIYAKNGGKVCQYVQLLGHFGANAGTITDKNVYINDEKKGDAFRSVHWTRQGIKYFRDQSVPLKGGLIIKTNQRGSYSNNYIYCKYPVIFLRKKTASHENTVYHELGHYIMYRLQNNHIKIPLGEKGVDNHRKRTENTGLLAWIEGWANAVQMILDAAHWKEDNEMELDTYGYTYENLERFDEINNGFRSEYHIATAIYDLWDGPGKGLPERTPCLNIHGWNDSIMRKSTSRSYYSWKSKDDVELSLAQICAPLQAVKKQSDMKHLQNVGQYYDKLLSQQPDCKGKADISRVFRENRVVWNIKDYENELYIGNLSSDNFFTTISKKERGFLRMEFPLWVAKWRDNYRVNIPFRNDTKQYFLYALPNNSLALTDDFWIGIYNTKGSNERVEVYLNPKANTNHTNLKHGRFYTCGSNQIWVRNGTLELGMPNSGYTAELTINENAALKIDAHGAVILNNNTTLRIAAGGTLHLQDKEAIVKRGNASVIVEEGARVYLDGALIPKLPE